MDILEKAKELGEMIGSSEQMLTFKKWEADLERDHKARAILREYQTLQTEMMRAAHEDAEKEVLDEIKQKLSPKFDEVNKCDITRNYLESKDRLDSLIKKVNDVLIYSITGEEQCMPEKRGSSCGRGCR